MPTFTPSKTAVRDQLHGTLLRLNHLASVQAIDGSPEGVVVGTRGDLVLDTSTAAIWIKTTGTPGGALTRTGWAPLGTAQSLAQGASISNASAGSGLVRTSVLEFSGVSNTGTGVIGSSDPNNGTEIAITEAGVYSVDLGFDLDPGTAIFGLSLNQTSDFSAIPSFATGGVLAVLQGTAPAAARLPCFVAQDVIVDQARAAAPGGAILRFIASDAAGLAPSAIVAGSGWYRVRRIAQVDF